MKLKLLRDDTRGAVIVEFSVTIGFFLVLTWGLIATGLLLWTYAGLQHGVEVATRCASVNYSAYYQFTPPLNTSCFTDPVTGHPTPSEVINDASNTYIKQYAAQNSFGLVPPSTKFGVTLTEPKAGACSTNDGYQITATYTFDVITWIFSPTITAQSKFPITCS
jgi:Flp pilus assembly protein TadG